MQLEIDHFWKSRLQHLFELHNEGVQIERGKTRLRLAGRGEQLLHEGRARARPLP